MKILITVYILNFLIFLQAQVPAIEWQKTFGGTGTEEVNSILPTKDNGYIISGYTDSVDGNISNNNGYIDAWVVKLNYSGNIEWEKNYGGTDLDIFNSIDQTHDNGYVLAGLTHSFEEHKNGDYWIVKIDELGNKEWEKSFGGFSIDHAKSIQQTSDFGFIVTGHTFSSDGDVTENFGASDYWVLKLDENGNLQWQKNLGGSHTDYAHSIKQTMDAGFILTGYTFSSYGDVTASFAPPDYWIVKLDKNGNIQWQKSLGGNNEDSSFSISQTFDSGYIVGGTTRSTDGDVTVNNGSVDCWVVKLDQNGNIQWQKTFGGSDIDILTSIVQTLEGGYAFSGHTASNDGDITNNQGNYDCWVVKLNANGDIQWQKTLGGSLSDYGNSIFQTSNGEYLIGGSTFSDDGDITLNQGMLDCWIVKLLPDGTAGVVDISQTNLLIYPNPVKDIIYFSEKLRNVEIYTFDGRKILQVHDVQNIPIQQLSTDTYIIKAALQSGQQITTKFIKE